jgi:hypothetical protein
MVKLLRSVFIAAVALTNSITPAIGCYPFGCRCALAMLLGTNQADTGLQFEGAGV